MHQKIVSLVVVGATVLLGLPSHAQYPRPVQSDSNVLTSDAVRSFLPVYTHYASAIQQHGLEGFKSMAAPDFTIHHGHDHWTGAPAFAQAAKYLDGSQIAQVFVTIRRVTITGKTAVALTQEVMTFSAPDESWKGTWLWKQTWRRVGAEWKLAAQERISKKALGPPPAIEYTVGG